MALKRKSLALRLIDHLKCLLPLSCLRPSLPCSKTATLPDTDRAEEPDWSDLPPELICLISRKIADISDFVRFRIVCKNWRSAVRASDLAPQLPWIILNLGEFKEGYLQFYSLLTGKIYTVNVPRSYSKTVMGSAYNFVVCFDSLKGSLFKFNPLTKEELSLLHFPVDFPFPFARSWQSGPSLYDPSSKFFPSCVLSGPFPPDQSSRYVVTSKLSGPIVPTPLYLCRPGDQEWTKIRDEFNPSGFTFNDGRCYATVKEIGCTMVIELATNTLIHVVPLPDIHERYCQAHLVVFFGQILRVCLVWHNKKYSFRIYQLAIRNRDGKQMEPYWTKIDNISNHFLFLGFNHGCAFSAEDFPGFVGNSIYFLQWDCVTKTNFLSFQLTRYDIKEREIEVLTENLGHCWFVPCLC